MGIHEFSKDVYGGAFDQVAWDLDEVRNPKYRHVALQDVNENLLLFSGPECCKSDLSSSLGALGLVRQLRVIDDWILTCET